jgi:hypothetical protein
MKLEILIFGPLPNSTLSDDLYFARLTEGETLIKDIRGPCAASSWLKAPLIPPHSSR